MASHWAERKKERQREGNILGSVTCSRLSHLYAANHSAAVYISHMIGDSLVPVRLPNRIRRLLALTSNETCDDSSDTGRGHASVLYAIFESLRRQTVCFVFPNDRRLFQTSLSVRLCWCDAHKDC